jgi:hypothetical protein
MHVYAYVYALVHMFMHIPTHIYTRMYAHINKMHVCAYVKLMPASLPWRRALGMYLYAYVYMCSHEFMYVHAFAGIMLVCVG